MIIVIFPLIQSLIQLPSEHQSEEKVNYDVDAFVQDAVALHITPFMLDSYRHEYEDRVVCFASHYNSCDNLSSAGDKQTFD